jgi:hypothetical protein
MKRSDLTEDDRDEEAVLALLELLQKFGDPLKRPAKVIPWPKRPSTRPKAKDRTTDDESRRTSENCGRSESTLGKSKEE